ncbi:hypothetical protein GGX14DRAFT_589042 [Mycena pura]|uniref:Uncharacterized protein n=1 Tax=Mycena pura TaxID=153505 RepID=A0AAD6URV3_9AGAR|nr:hypothetical protein GGX14DRAFT_589042 [Mycena pura]
MPSSSTTSTDVQNGPSRPDRCDYSVSWMDRTFSTRRKCESLLGPELENGNLTRNDYDALMAALPGVPYSNLIGLSAGGIGAIALSRPKPPSLSAGLLAYACGSTFGKVLRVYTHQKFFRSVENINGFSRALDNVKRKVGYTPGLINFSRPLAPADWEHPPFQQEADTPYGGPIEPIPPAAAAPTSVNTQTSPVRSRWEEIRAARRVEGPGKAWENIRQGRTADGSPLPKLEPQSSSNDSSLRDDNRAIAQASFDAMLERERKMNST